MKILILLFYLCICQPLLSQNTHNVTTGYWYYSDDYSTKQLILKENNKFHWYFSSCEGSECYSGKYEQNGDSLFLNIENCPKQVKFLIRDDKIFTYRRQDNEYPVFEPLSFVGRQKRLKCNDEVIEIMKINE